MHLDPVEVHLTSLERLAPHVSEHGCDASAQDAARELIRYFDSSTPARENKAIGGAYALLRARLQEIANGRSLSLSVAQIASFSRCFREHALREALRGSPPRARA